MDTFLTLANDGVIFLQQARRFTEEEKLKYAKWFQDVGMVAVGESTKLPFLTWRDLPKREGDGEFPGCNNCAWIITREEADRYIKLNEENQREQQQKEIERTRKEMLQVIEMAGRQKKLYTAEEAERMSVWYNNANNDGGYGFVPHFYTIDEVEEAKRWLAEHGE